MPLPSVGQYGKGCGQYYALINRARGPYEEIFVLTFKAYGPNEVRSVRLNVRTNISRMDRNFG